ncbi:hypothetical protein [Streptomyces sp. NBC_01320]|uniref:hypothetical protein n=1 Tax=Streptomyces sp. NBC_01320 TaxID=2903824 RepID=UPI002E0F121D|nr:hypothetical protein OG395_55845 [Streptomyces sp. NBC_01320]
MSTVSRLVPYITAREGEEPESYLALRASFDGAGLSALGYWDESGEDRDPRGVLWGRCSQSIGLDGLPSGQPQWRLIHPARQRETMTLLNCQICAGPTRTAEGYPFLASAAEGDPRPGEPTAQPPVCLAHMRVAVEQCPHLQRGYTALMVRSAPLYGVIGTPYEWTAQGINALAGDDTPVPYRDPALKWFLASQLVRTLRDFTVVDLDDLTTLDSIA